MLESLLDRMPELGPIAYLLVFAGAAMESALFVGLVVPGETLLLVAGVLAARGDGALWVYMVAGVTGAIAGDSIGYEVGRHLGQHLRESRLGSWVGEERWDKAEKYLREKGGRAIFTARWIGVVRAVVPALAGQAKMPYRRFLFWNVAGAIPVAVLHVGIGYLAAENIGAVDRVLGTAQWLVLGLAIAGFVGYRFWKNRRASTSRSRVA